jgi:Trk K+ transport system NAD-binding subunit
MTTAIIGIGHIGGTLARELAAGGESVVLSAVNTDNVKKVASEIGGPASLRPATGAQSRGPTPSLLPCGLTP